MNGVCFLRLNYVVTMRKHTQQSSTNDALRICKARQQGKGRLVLTSEDLAQSARDYGIHIRKPGYFADAPSLGGGHIS